MIKFSFHSFVFQPPLQEHKEVCLNIEMENGSFHQTESFIYTPHKTSTLNKISDFTTLYLEKDTSFKLEVCEFDKQISQKLGIIGSETISFDNIPSLNHIELAIPTIYGADAVITLAIDILSEIVPRRDATSKDKLTRFKENANLAKLLPLLHKCVTVVSPFYLAKQRLAQLFNWTDPLITLGVALGFSAFVWAGNYFLGLGLLLFALFGNWMIPTIIEQDYRIAEDINKLNIYKRNLNFVKNMIRNFLVVFKYYEKIVCNPDKTLMTLLLREFRKYAFVLSLFFLFLSWQTIIIISFWSILLFQHPKSRKFMFLAFKRLSKSIDTVTRTISYPQSMKMSAMKKRHEDKMDSKSHDTHSTNAEAASQDTLPSWENLLLKDVKRKTEERTFTVYENQRWWLGKGWKANLLPGERDAWSDELGMIELRKEDVQLPNEKWEWVTDWRVVMEKHCDYEGWEYASRFRNFREGAKKKKKFMQPVRRRKWVRIGAVFEDSDS